MLLGIRLPGATLRCGLSNHQADTAQMHSVGTRHRRVPTPLRSTTSLYLSIYLSLSISIYLSISLYNLSIYLSIYRSPFSELCLAGRPGGLSCRLRLSQLLVLVLASSLLLVCAYSCIIIISICMMTIIIIIIFIIK